LSVWTRLARLIGYGGGSEHLTVHRFLVDPRAGGRATPTRLHDVLADVVSTLEAPRILDAGCGLGGTMLDLVRRFGGTAIGLTLSPAQQAKAEAVASARGLASSIRVHVRSYDDPPEGPFDLIVAIESLAHSRNPAVSIAALSRVLAPGGRIVIIDDMPEPDAEGSLDLGTFKRGWQAPVLWDRRQFIEGLAAAGMTLTDERDLTPECRVRTLSQIARLERLNVVLRACVPRRWRVVLDSYHGGLALERLYRRGQMRYRLLVATKLPTTGNIGPC
jgi:27-O-demethylrifamycin SV methyltransferase